MKFLCLALVNVRSNVSKTSKTFRPNNFGLHVFLKRQVQEWWLSNGSQFCMCYASKNYNEWLRHVIMQLICKGLGCQYVGFHHCLSEYQALRKSLLWELQADERRSCLVETFFINIVCNVNKSQSQAQKTRS